MDGMKLEVISATLGQPRAEECAATWGCPITWIRGLPMMEAYQKGFEESKAAILVYAHDDLILREPWQDRVLAFFEDESVGVVGLGGALVHGDPDLYKTPYKLQQLGRGSYLSNSDDAEGCGERFDGSCEVAVAEGFFLAVRRKLLEKCGGWPHDKFPFHNYDYFISCSAHRHGYKVFMTGLRCLHLGGATSVGMKADDGKNHGPAHKWLYENFRDCLPYSVARPA